MSFVSQEFLQQIVLNLTICSSIWSLFIYVTRIKFRYYQSAALIALHVALSFILTPYLGVTIVATLFYLAIINYKMPDSPLVENFFFALYPPVLFSILWNILARFIYPLLFNHHFDFLVNNFIWEMLLMIGVILVERFLREFYQTDYVALKNSVWLDENTKRNFFLVYLEMGSYFILQTLLDVLSQLHVSQIWSVSLTTLYVVIAIVYFIVFMKVLILIDYYSRSYMKELRQKEQQHYLESLERYSQQIESLYGLVRSFKHDYNNILISLKGSIDSGDIDQVSQVFDEIFRDNIADLGKQDSQGQLLNILVPEVRTYLYVKKNSLESEGISLTFDIPNLILDCGVTSSAGVMILDAMFERIHPLLKQDPQLEVTVRIHDDGKQQYYAIVLSPCSQEALAELPAVSIETQKMLNHYKAFSLQQSLDDGALVQTLAVEVRKEVTP